MEVYEIRIDMDRIDMDINIKKLWVKALRSGKYKKGVGSLHPTEDTYCCLGVLCDLYNKKQKHVNTVVSLAGELLPERVFTWAKLPNNSPKPYKASLILINDRHRKSFKYIANLIEKYL